MTQSVDTGAPRDPLDLGAIDALVAGAHGAPFDVLGPHRAYTDVGVRTFVRTFQPDAEHAWLIPQPERGGESATSALKRLPMTCLHPAGLFSVALPEGVSERYQLEVERKDGRIERVVDPYALPALFSDFDLYLIGEGRHLDLYERLGAHLRTVDGVSGVAFAVWAPNARRVSVIGDFNGWDDRVYPMRLHANGVWELFIPGVEPGARYKYAILSWNREYRVHKADPFAFWSEVRPGNASRVFDLNRYTWSDERWLAERADWQVENAPMLVYEVHVGSWRTPSAGGEVNYRDLAHQLVPYLIEMGYTHVELMPIAEYPFDPSWGYQVTGYYAPTSRYGAPDDFMYFVDYCHQHGIGVILDWVPAHFPRDQHGLAFFDGSHLYEHADPRQGEHPDWGTLVFNYGRNEVRNFLIANALYWLEKYHVDGLRVDAVASMLYLDYSRKDGEWVPNRYGGRENLEAIVFLQDFNATVHSRFPGALTIAEESTAWPGVTRAAGEGGLGFSLKWNMGWMHDILEYMRRDPAHRKFHHNELTFSMLYAYSERYVLPFSHDEVVHVKGSMLNKMPGDRWQKFANLRALYAYMAAHPGKKLLFMGGELAQWDEWKFAGSLQWDLLDERSMDGPLHVQVHRLVRDLNQLVRERRALHERDFSADGFEWIDGSDAAQSVISFLRYGADKVDPLLIVCNFTPVPRPRYRVGTPFPGRYREIVNTDATQYGGSGVINDGTLKTEKAFAHGRAHSVALTLPPLGVVMLALEEAR
ncbi:MAG TPA: 1,4-alpha-glucan branching protein GlgB [Ktedonobacterales bacterium]|jgi:1,4-alpha-glucan branching enzyme